MPAMDPVEEPDGDDARRVIERKGRDTVQNVHRGQASRTPGTDASATIGDVGDAPGRTAEPARRAFDVTRRSVQRRPSGEPPPLPKATWWPRIVAIVAVVILLGFVMVAAFGSNPPYGLLGWFARFQHDPFVDIAKVLNWFATKGGIITLRIAMAIVLISFLRVRHLVVAIVAIGLMDLIVTSPLVRFELNAPQSPVIVPPTSGHWYFPASAIASLSITLGVMVFSLAPTGMWRRRAFAVALALAAGVVLARAILGATYLYAGAYSVALGFTVAAFAFGWLAPDDAFPVSYRRGGNAAHLDLTNDRVEAITRALRGQLGLTVTGVEPFGEEGSGGSTPLLMTLQDGSRVFGKILATSHVRSDRWYRMMRTIMYGRLEDETSFSSVRQLIGQEDYALRLLDDDGFSVAHTYGIVELTPNQEYLLAEQFFDKADTLGHATVDDTIIDQGIRLVRRLWDWGLAHRDLKPANMLVVDGHLQVIDVSGLEIRPSPWRQAVDLANMMLVLALRTDAQRVYDAALRHFTPDDVAEAFAAAQGMAIPTELQRHLKNDPRDLIGEFRTLAPSRPPISIQRWSSRRIGLTAAVVGGTLVLTIWSLAVFFRVLD